jgi:predicted metal-dependent peptidase
MATAAVIHPRRVTDHTGRVVFVRDTSGSVDDLQVAEFNAMIADSMRETGCSAYIIDADAEVHAEYEVDHTQEIPPKAEGGGGTDFRPVFARVRELAEDGMEIAGIIYLTDLDGPEPGHSDVDHHLLWLATTDRVARTGRTVRLK